MSDGLEKSAYHAQEFMGYGWRGKRVKVGRRFFADRRIRWDEQLEKISSLGICLWTAALQMVVDHLGDVFLGSRADDLLFNDAALE